MNTGDIGIVRYGGGCLNGQTFFNENQEFALGRVLGYEQFHSLNDDF